MNLEGKANWRSHNEDGTLLAPPHDETGHTWHHETEMLFDYTKLGGQVTLEAVGIKIFTSGMPAFGGVLTDEQIWEVLSFIRSTWPQYIQDAHATRHLFEKRKERVVALTCIAFPTREYVFLRVSI